MSKIIKWTKEEDSFLINNFNKYSISEISNMMGNRTYKGVHKRASRLGLIKKTSNSPKRWSEAEELLLIENYNIIPIDELYNLFSDRTNISVKAKLGRLGLLKKITKWTKEEELIIINNHNEKTIKELSEMLVDRTPLAIEAKLRRMGLSALAVYCGWSKSNWIRLGEASKKNNKFKLYKIKCWNDNECFYKIGITFQRINQRFSSKKMPYNYEIIEIIESNDGEYIWNLENELKNTHRSIGLQYIPKIEFRGMYECFLELV